MRPDSASMTTRHQARHAQQYQGRHTDQTDQRRRDRSPYAANEPHQQNQCADRNPSDDDNATCESDSGSSHSTSHVLRDVTGVLDG